MITMKELSQLVSSVSTLRDKKAKSEDEISYTFSKQASPEVLV